MEGIGLDWIGLDWIGLDGGRNRGRERREDLDLEAQKWREGLWCKAQLIEALPSKNDSCAFSALF